jgi:hypothetical protein
MMNRHCRRRDGRLIVLILLPLLLTCGCARDGAETSLFQDDFDNPRSGWGAEQAGRFERGYEEGEYFIQLHEPNWFAWAYPGEQFDDVSVEVDVYLASGSQDGHFGVLCRYVDLDNFYYLAISADGYYAIFRRVDGGVLEVLTGDGRGMTYSPAVRTDRQTNRVLAVCQADELALHVNGALLETVIDGTFPSGDVGIGAGTGAQGDVRVQFDNFLVTKP